MSRLTLLDIASENFKIGPVDLDPVPSFSNESFLGSLSLESLVKYNKGRLMSLVDSIEKDFDSSKKASKRIAADKEGYTAKLASMDLSDFLTYFYHRSLTKGGDSLYDARQITSLYDHNVDKFLGLLEDIHQSGSTSGASSMDGMHLFKFQKLVFNKSKFGYFIEENEGRGAWEGLKRLYKANFFKDMRAFNSWKDFSRNFSTNVSRDTHMFASIFEWFGATGLRESAVANDVSIIMSEIPVIPKNALKRLRDAIIAFDDVAEENQGIYTNVLNVLIDYMSETAAVLNQLAVRLEK